jgi:hypothetical protein
MRMNNAALSAYSRFVKIAIVGGILFFFAIGGMSLWFALADSPTGTAMALFLAMAAGFGGLGWFGLRLLPFVHTSCAATPKGLYIFDRYRQEKFVPWSSVSRVKDWSTLQVVDIYDLHGKRVLSIDYYISNFELFHAQLLKSAPTIE